MKPLIPLIALGLLFGMGQAPAQDESPGAAAEVAKLYKQVLVDALGQLNQEGAFVFEGSVGVSMPEEDSGGMGGIMIMGGGGPAGVDFEGDIAIWRTADKELVVASTEALPGLAYYTNGDREITQINFDDEPFKTANVTGDLASLFDTSRLIDAAMNGEFTTERIEEQNALRFKGILSKKIIKSAGGGQLGFMAPKVLRVEVEFCVGPNKTVDKAVFTVVRTDPMAAMKRQAMEGGGRVTSMGMPEASKEEGQSLIYSLTRAGAKPTQRIKEFTKSVRAILENEEF